MSDWLLPFGEDKGQSLTPGLDAGMKESAFTGQSLTPGLDEGMAKSNFGIGSRLGTENSTGDRWQLPMNKEERNQSIMDRLAARKQRADITTGMTMARGIGELLKSDEFKNFLRKKQDEF